MLPMQSIFLFVFFFYFGLPYNVWIWWNQTTTKHFYGPPREEKLWKNICMFMFTWSCVLVVVGYRATHEVLRCHTWDKEFPHMFSALQLDLLKRWLPWDCIHRIYQIPKAMIPHISEIYLSTSDSHFKYIFFSLPIFYFAWAKFIYCACNLSDLMQLIYIYYQFWRIYITPISSYNLRWRKIELNILHEWMIFTSIFAFEWTGWASLAFKSNSQAQIQQRRKNSTIITATTASWCSAYMMVRHAHANVP